MARLGGKAEMARAVAIGSGKHLNRARKDLQNCFPHNFPHNYQEIFLKRERKSSGVLLGLPPVAGCFVADCFDTEYFCTQCFVADCFDTEYFCTQCFVADCFDTDCFGTEYFVAGCVCAGCFVAGCFVAGCFCAEYFCAQRSDSDLLAESIAIVRELD